MEVILQLRGNNVATVKDIVDLRKFIRTTMNHNAKMFDQIRDDLSGEISAHMDEVNKKLAALKRAQRDSTFVETEKKSSEFQRRGGRIHTQSSKTSVWGEAEAVDENDAHSSLTRADTFHDTSYLARML